MTAVEQDMGEHTANQIIFFTDGMPTAGDIQDPDEMVEAVTAANENGARIYSFGFGDDSDSQFLAELSDENHGIFTEINPNEQDIDEVISEFYEYISNPALVNPEYHFTGGLELDEVYPRELQDLAAGKQLYLFGRYESFGEFDFELSGSNIDGDTTIVFEGLEFPEENNENAFVPRMWAKSVIDYWLNWMAINGEDQDIIERIIELSLEYGILTPYTEYEPPHAIDIPEYSRISADRNSNGVRISWDFVGVTQAVGFNVYRSFRINGEYSRLNEDLITETQFLDTQIYGFSQVYYKIEAIVDGKSHWSDLIIVGEMPEEAGLIEVHPNPFNDQTKIKFALNSTGNIQLTLIDIKGRELLIILEGLQQQGTHTVGFNAGNLPAGIYFIKLIGEEVSVIKTIVLLK